MGRGNRQVPLPCPLFWGPLIGSEFDRSLSLPLPACGRVTATVILPIFPFRGMPAERRTRQHDHSHDPAWIESGFDRSLSPSSGLREDDSNCHPPNFFKKPNLLTEHDLPRPFSDRMVPQWYFQPTNRSVQPTTEAEIEKFLLLTRQRVELHQTSKTLLTQHFGTRIALVERRRAERQE